MERINQRYNIKEIDYKTAMDFIIIHHYLHRKCPCSQAFGLFEQEKLTGVIIYGTPSSSSLRAGLCGIEERFNVIELTRLCILDNTPKNTESYLIGSTLKKVKKEIIVSYADSEQGHIGIVYQATNWLYTGLSAKRTNWHIEGIKNMHSQTMADKHTSKELREMYGDRFKLIDRPRKHRYVFFNAKGYRRKELISKLKYKILPYPKK